MENLRAFMAVSDVKDQCMQEFTYEPENLENDPSLSESIAENGFVMHFSSDNDRKQAIQVVSGLGFVKNFQELDEEPVAQPAAPAEPASEPRLRSLRSMKLLRRRKRKRSRRQRAPRRKQATHRIRPIIRLSRALSASTCPSSTN